MTNLQRHLQQAGKALNVEVQLGSEIELSDGSRLTPIALLPTLGADRGMIVVSSYEEIRPHLEALERDQYDYSVMDEPSSSQNFDLQSYKELFEDWGWGD